MESPVCFRALIFSFTCFLKFLRHFLDMKNYNNFAKAQIGKISIKKLIGKFSIKMAMLLRRAYDFIWNWLGFSEALHHYYCGACASWRSTIWQRCARNDRLGTDFSNIFINHSISGFE